MNGDRKQAGPVRELAPDYVTLYESPDPQRTFGYSPGIARLDGGRLVATTGGRLIATIDVGGPGAAELKGVKYHNTRRDSHWQGRVYTSDDGGQTWTHRANFPFMHARPFVAGDAVYVLGQAGDLTVMSSRDGGATWGDPVKLTEGQTWHQAPCNVLHALRSTATSSTSFTGASTIVLRRQGPGVVVHADRRHSVLP